MPEISMELSLSASIMLEEGEESPRVQPKTLVTPELLITP